VIFQNVRLATFEAARARHGVKLAEGTRLPQSRVIELS
jgi:hypothetical protein